MGCDEQADILRRMQREPKVAKLVLDCAVQPLGDKFLATVEAIGKSIVSRKFDTEEEAQAWLDSHLAALRDSRKP